MREGSHVQSYREILSMAPFSWNTGTRPDGMFALPHITKLDNSILSTNESSDATPEKVKPDDEEMREEAIVTVKRKLIDEDIFMTLSESTHYAKSEIEMYKKSILYMGA